MFFMPRNLNFKFKNRELRVWTAHEQRANSARTAHEKRANSVQTTGANSHATSHPNLKIKSANYECEQRANNTRTAIEQRANCARAAYEQRASSVRELVRATRELRANYARTTSANSPANYAARPSCCKQWACAVGSVGVGVGVYFLTIIIYYQVPKQKF